MTAMLIDPGYGERDFAAELAALDAAGVLVASEDREAADGPILVDETDWFDPPGYQMSKLDAFEWEMWAGVDQDDAERMLLEQKAPAWVFLPPGAELAAALEQVRPQTESPIALIELMKAAGRMESWCQAQKMSAMASFERQRQAEAADIPRPSDLDARGRPTDPERSRAAEIGCALRLSPTTVRGHIDTALRLTSVLTATHTALRCGAITLAKALAIADATSALAVDRAQAVEAHVLKRASSQTHANLHKSLRRQVAKYDTKNQADQHHDAVTKRECRVVALADGMAGLWVVHTADKIQQIWIVIQAMADLAKRGTPTPPTTVSTAPTQGQGQGQGQAPTEAHASTAAQARSQDQGQASTAAQGTDAAGEDAATEAADAPTTGMADAPTTGIEDGPTTGMEDGVEPAVDSAANGSTDGADSNATRATAPAAPAQTAATRAEATDTNQDRDSDRNNTPGGEEGASVGRDGDGPGGDGRGKGGRSADQRRADVVVDLFEYMLRNGLDWLGRRFPDQHGRKAHIEVTTAATTLLGLDDEPCELAGYGPIPAEMARRIATDGTWRRLLTDPVNGTVLEASTTRHNPGFIVSETLLARYLTCCWSGCNRPARECDRDHGTPFAQTGQTALAGMDLFCEFHHVIKDTPAWGWKTTNNNDGSITLTAPTGHRYTTQPPARGPITTPPTQPQPEEPPPF